MAAVGDGPKYNPIKYPHVNIGGWIKSNVAVTFSSAASSGVPPPRSNLFEETPLKDQGIHVFTLILLVSELPKQNLSSQGTKVTMKYPVCHCPFIAMTTPILITAKPENSTYALAVRLPPGVTSEPVGQLHQPLAL